MKRENAITALRRLNYISKREYGIYSAYGYHTLVLKEENGAQFPLIRVKTYADLVEVINGIYRIIQVEKD